MFIVIAIVILLVLGFVADRVVDFDDFADWFLHKRTPFDIVFSLMMWVVSDGWWCLLTIIHYLCVKHKKTTEEN
jgi:hypothetical protein